MWNQVPKLHWGDHLENAKALNLFAEIFWWCKRSHGTVSNNEATSEQIVNNSKLDQIMTVPIIKTVFITLKKSEIILRKTNLFIYFLKGLVIVTTTKFWSISLFHYCVEFQNLWDFIMIRSSLEAICETMRSIIWSWRNIVAIIDF